MAEVPPEGEENSEPLKYKTWVLKVSIHCEGCKRKVKRILHSVEGVYTIDVDTKQHKVIVTGNVEANTLLRKLEKSGKHAELFPNKNNSQNELEPPPPPPQPPQNEEHHNNQTQNQPVNVDQQQNPQNPPKEVRFAENVPAGGGNQNPPLNVVSGGAAKKKKKKKKSNNSTTSSTNNSNNNNSAVNNNNNEASEEQQQGPQQQHNELPPQQQYMGPGPGYPGPGPVNMSPPRPMGQSSRMYEYPPVYHAPPQPAMCGVSYNTSYPRSYTASYYSARPPYSYAYTHNGGDVEVSMPLDLSGGSLQPPDTFELFSDENPNACSVM